MSDYNGWTNYETWNVHLWITNVADSEAYWRHRAKAVGDPYTLALELRHWLDENAPELPTGLYSDLLRASLSEVNHLEIAQALSAD